VGLLEIYSGLVQTSKKFAKFAFFYVVLFATGTAVRPAVISKNLSTDFQKKKTGYSRVLSSWLSDLTSLVIQTHYYPII
jgi:hypothetical protein